MGAYVCASLRFLLTTRSLDLRITTSPRGIIHGSVFSGIRIRNPSFSSSSFALITALSIHLQRIGYPSQHWST